MSGGTAQNAAAASDRFAAAHAALKADPQVQFTLSFAPARPKPPAWIEQVLHWLAKVLEPVARLLGWITRQMPAAPYARIFLWTLIAGLAVLLLWVVYQRIRHGEWRWPTRKRARQAAVVENDPDWQPESAPARAWLREADALAAEGRYAEAVHLLLIRSVDDIARRRPRVVRPALTARELGAANAVPPAARGLFAGIAALVERSLFGGRPVDAGEWAAARTAYADFALPGTWRE
ncbi:DUF4129 domain-containing protein [Sphingomonas sp. PAMC 26617]|uniref:DUF4129 domain-containing protein n=1 Tax=Sphingomonas sp. PAMC 26617 TaxID=1112216 RepID=UPI0002892934|nr:DUF4129 domain-containing protein [Sphingomonas sp. PAMC 26617]